MVGRVRGLLRAARRRASSGWDLPAPWPRALRLSSRPCSRRRSPRACSRVAAEALCYRPIRKAGRIAALLTAVGLSLLLQNIARQSTRSAPRSGPGPRRASGRRSPTCPSPADANYYELRTFPDAGAAGPCRRRSSSSRRATRSRRPPSRAARARRARARLPQGRRRPAPRRPRRDRACCSPPALALWLLVQRTRMGRAMRAVSEDMAAARLMGVNVNRVVAATFFLGAFLAGLGGVALLRPRRARGPADGLHAGAQGVHRRRARRHRLDPRRDRRRAVPRRRSRTSSARTSRRSGRTPSRSSCSSACCSCARPGSSARRGGRRSDGHPPRRSSSSPGSGWPRC